MLSALSISFSYFVERRDDRIIRLIEGASGTIEYFRNIDSGPMTSWKSYWRTSRLEQVRSIEFRDPARYRDSLRLIEQLPHVEEVEIDNFTSEMFRFLPRSNSLRKLTIVGFSIKDDDLLALGRMPNLEELVLTELYPGTSSLQKDSLSALPANCKIKTMHLSVNGVLEATHLSGIENLEYLNSLSIRTDGIKSLEPLQRLNRLSSLNVGIFRPGFTQHCLAEIFSLRELKQLSLSGRMNMDCCSAKLIPIGNKLQSLSLCYLDGASPLLNQLDALTNLVDLTINRNDARDFSKLPEVDRLEIIDW